MTTLIEFPSVVLHVTGYLRTALTANGYPGIRVADKLRGDDAEVWVQPDGGPTLDRHRYLARIRVNVFHKGATDGPVDDLARRVSTLMRGMADGEPVVRVTQSTGPTSIADTLPRIYMAFEVLVRGADL